MKKIVTALNFANAIFMDNSRFLLKPTKPDLWTFAKSILFKYRCQINRGLCNDDLSKSSIQFVYTSVVFLSEQIKEEFNISE